MVEIYKEETLKTHKYITNWSKMSNNFVPTKLEKIKFDDVR